MTFEIKIWACSVTHANPPNHHVNPLQAYKKLNWSKSRGRSGKHASSRSRSGVGLPPSFYVIENSFRSCAQNIILQLMTHFRHQYPPVHTVRKRTFNRTKIAPQMLDIASVSVKFSLCMWREYYFGGTCQN